MRAYRRISAVFAVVCLGPSAYAESQASLDLEELDELSVRAEAAAYEIGGAVATIDAAADATEIARRIRVGVGDPNKRASIGLTLRREVHWSPGIRTVSGLRMDTVAIDASDDISSFDVPKALQLSRHSSLVIAPAEWLELYASSALGFHDDDTRALTRSADPSSLIADIGGYEIDFVTRVPKLDAPTARAFGYEAGARVSVAGRFAVAASAWNVALDGPAVSERHAGVELEARARVSSWLYTDLDVTASRGNARRSTLNAGLAAVRGDVFGRAGLRSEDGNRSPEFNIGFRGARHATALVADNERALVTAKLLF